MVLILKSFNKNVLNFFINSIISSFRFGPEIKIVRLPSVSKRWTVIKSPHVNSKSKEQFEMKTHRCLLKLSNLRKSELIYFQNYLKINLIPGIAVKVQHKF
jgi:small subunit ribosomal protein S10